MFKKIIFDDTRGTGQTTKQIMDAPPNALYIWCNNDFYYIKNLARKLNRTDINFCDINNIIFGKGGELRGTPWNKIVIDHAVGFTRAGLLSHIRNG